MELFKTRDFGALFSDTFSFFGENWKHFLKNYVIINGTILIISILSFIPLLTLFIDFSTFELQGNGDIKDIFLDTVTSGMFFAYLIFTFVIGFMCSAVTYSFTPLYLKLYQERGGTNFSTSELIDSLKIHFPKAIKYLIGFIILSIPLMIVLMLAMVLVACTIVGLFIPIAVFMMLISFTMYEYYFKPENRFFNSFGYAWDLIKYKFWHSVGCVALLMILVAVIQQVLSFVMELILNIKTNNLIIDENFEFTSDMIVAIIISSLFTMVISFVINSITLLNQGIIFYSLKGEKEHLSTGSSIDQIGSGE